MLGGEFYKNMKKFEKDVANYLNKIELDWYYEHPVFLFDEKRRPRVWTPDFYLPKLKVHIEVCGSKDFDYDYRNEIYIKNNISVIFIHHYKSKNEWQKWFGMRIMEIEEERHNDVMKTVKRLMG